MPCKCANSRRAAGNSDILADAVGGSAPEAVVGSGAIFPDVRIETRPEGLAFSTAPLGACAKNPCSTSANLSSIRAGQSPAAGIDCTPIYPEPTPADILQNRRACTDPTGCTALYREECRDGFWPDFAHPTWLCCGDLYNAAQTGGGSGGCGCSCC